MKKVIEDHKISLLFIGNKLSNLGFTPCVIETLGPLLEKEGYRVNYAGTFKNRLLRLAEMLWKTATTGRKVDYILIDTYSTSAFWYAYLTGSLARVLDTKYIPVLHGGDLPRRLKSSERACNSLFKNSYANVAVSGYLKHEFDKAGYRTVLIPNSIDISIYPFRLRENHKPGLLWVRAFHRQYNPIMAADVLILMLKNYPDSQLCMVGPDKDGSMEEFKQYIRNKGIENNVKITGKLSREEWISLSQDYDFFINTTNVDNTPVSVIEAMALGMCVVSTRPGGIPYLLEDGRDALLVEPGDSAAMTNKIVQLLGNKLLAAELSENARKKAEGFDWKNIIPKWVEMFEELDN